MKIATFNINGIKARIAALPAWLEEAQPDVALLQEIKSVDEAFPRDVFEDLGYRVETHGQKSFNGVAILSRLPLEDVTRGLPGGDKGKIGLDVSPANPDVVYAIVEAKDGQGGFYRTTNRGASWQRMSGYASSAPILKIWL